ncbi:MAG: hypothetical protein G01um101491_333 [Parcubacteria group bacterium Gr01-1014_91]|nr:MAG: hypothetical protein G01um101491_333 [Parcubacteria group bacterium Gr01-1014_91]
MNTTNVVRFPTKFRVIHRRQSLGNSVLLDRGAEGQHGWLSEARAMLISGENGEEKGRILLVAFMDKRPLRCNLKDEQCIRVPSAMCPEDVIAARAWRTGIASLGCRFYSALFPCYWCTLFLARTGITHLYYAHLRDEKSLPERELSKFEVSGVKVTRVTI